MSGKTTQLIKMAHRENLYIVCANQQRVTEIVRLAKKMEMDIPFPLTAEELPLRSSYIKEVLVDDIEDVLQYLIRKPIKMATTSMTVKEINF